MSSAATSINTLTLPLSSRGTFNKANLKKVMPNFHQHVSCPTRGPNTLDHCYTQFKNAYKARSLPAFGKSDHAAIFLTLEYKQRIVQEPPVEREVTRWSSHSEAMLQAALDDVDWDMLHTMPVFCQETWASTKHRAMLSDGQLELPNSDTGRELSHIFSSMTLDACGRDWRPSVPLEITPPQRWEQIRCWPKS